MYLVDNDESDIYPFHHDVMVDGSLINLYNLNTGRVKICYQSHQITARYH